MRNREEIMKDLAEVDDKKKAIQGEIQDKERELAEARQAHKALLARYVGNAKKPVSLGVQRERIKSLESELEDLREISFDDQRAELQRELRLCDVADEIQTYSEKASRFFEKVDQAMSLLSEAAETGPRLEVLVQELRNGNPIAELSAIFSRLDDLSQLEGSGFGGTDRYRFLTKVINLEKQLETLIRAAKNFSDLVFGIENIGLRNLRYPPDNRKTKLGAPTESINAGGRFAGDTWQARQMNKNLSAFLA